MTLGTRNIPLVTFLTIEGGAAEQKKCHQNSISHMYLIGNGEGFLELISQYFDCPTY